MYYMLALNTAVKERMPGKSGDVNTWKEVNFIGNATRKASTVDLCFFSEENDKWKRCVSHAGVAMCVVVFLLG